MAKLTTDQIKENIDSLKAQGAPTSTIQSYLDSLKTPAGGPPQQSFMQKAEGMATNALPTIGGIGGGIAGGILGAAGGPVGAFAGAVAGSTAGGAAGEYAKENFQGTPPSAKNIATQGGIQGAFEAVGGPLAKLAGKAVEGVGAGIAKAVIPITKQEAYLTQVYKASNSFLGRIGQVLTGGGKAPPVTSGSTAFDKGLIGTETGIGIRSKRAADTLWNKFIDPALTKSNVKVSVPAFFAEAKAQIIKDTQELGDQASKLKALDSLSAEYKNMETATMKQLQEFKKAWASKVPQKAYLGEDITAAYNNVRNTLAGLARTKIYNTLGPEVRQAYLDHGNLQGLQQLGQKAMTGAGMKGGFGNFWSTVKDMLVVPAGTIGGQTLYKVGQGIEMFGPAGVKTVGALLGIGQQATASPSPAGQTSGTPSSTSSTGLQGTTATSPAGGLQQPQSQPQSATPPPIQ